MSLHLDTSTLISPVMHVQGISMDSYQTSVRFPQPGITLPTGSFRKAESLPQIHLPKAFIVAASGIETSAGKVFSESVCSLPVKCEFCVPGNETISVVNVVMKNMENYLPSDVVVQNETM